MRFELRSLASEVSRQDILHTAFLIEQVCLVVVLQIAVINLFSQVVKPLDLLLPSWLLHMSLMSAAAALAATLALYCSESSRPRATRIWGKFFAVLTATLGAMTLVAFSGQKLSWFHFSNPALATRGALPAYSLAFLMVGIVILFIRSHGGILGISIDVVVSCLAFLILLLVSELGFGAAGVEQASTTGLASTPTLGCLAFLVVAVVIRRADHGLFSMFLGSGIGGRIARMLTPILIILPFFRELLRARVIGAQIVPLANSTALLASLATAVSFALLVLLTRVINRMQRDIQDLTLRDELTGLYNFRGFNLFAEQAFRLARRARVPFGVLFIDMDNLKSINDELGHNAGSACIAETAKLLNETFRETDVIGRLGGDEFVVAGQFEDKEIESMIARLRSEAALRKGSANCPSLSFSMGFAATELAPGESLKSVVTRADQAMYREKREKKRLVLA